MASVLKCPLRVALLATIVCSSVVRLCSAQEAPEAVTKVVTLLTELQARVEQDETEEQSVFDKYACWCEKSTQKKATTITAARDQIEKVGNSILQLKGSVATTLAEIKQIMSDIRTNEQSQKEATAVREKENAAFAAESAELSQALSALEQAIKLLKGATGGAALIGHAQHHGADVATALATARSAMAHLPHNARSKVQQGVALISTKSRYQPQSATIQGILSDMYSTFGSTLETLTHTEASRHRAFEDLMASYRAELQTMQKILTKKESSKAEAEIMLAEATESYADIEAQLKADVEYFDATKASCVSKGQEWRDRKALRAEELDGITKALEVLSSDEARELFAKAIQPGFQPAFLQTDASDEDIAPLGAQLDGAFRQLRAHALQSHSLRLAALASSLRTADNAMARDRGVGHFDKVLEAIDTMVVTLKEEEQTDIKRADECGVQLHTIARTKDELGWKVENNVAKIDKLGKIKDDKELDKTNTVEELGAVEKEITDMTDQRAADNAKFLQAKADDEQAIVLLRNAKTVLAQFYEKNGMNVNVSLLAKSKNGTVSEDEPEPDATFSGKGDRKLEAKGIVGMLEMIAQDLEAEVSGSVKAEAVNQLDFESRLAAAETLKEELTKRRNNLDEALALNHEQTLDESDLQSENEQKLETEKQTETDLKPSCDWIRDNIAPRRTKRATEMEGLRTAREYLAGAEPASLTQRRGLVHRHARNGRSRARHLRHSA